MNKQLLLRDYPQNWEILPLVRFAGSGNTDFVDGPFGSDLKVSDYTKTGVRVLQLQNLGDGLFINKSKIYTSQKKALMLSRCLTYPGDIIIAKMAEPLARAALVPAYEDKYLIVADLIKLRIARDIDPYYLLCFINFSDFRKEAERLSTGTTRTRISLSTLKKISVPKPPIELQKKLGLIFQTIDRTIAKTEALIEKYQQIKAGLMHDLFTRGIGADGKLRSPREVAPELYKNSAIGWIPKEWKVGLFGDNIEVIDPNPSHRYPSEVEDGYPICSTENFEGEDDFNFRKSKFVPETTYQAQNNKCRFKPTDVIFARKGKIGLARRYGQDKKVFSHTVVVMKPFSRSVDNNWLLWLSRSDWLLKGIDATMNTNLGVPTLGVEFIKNIAVPFPKDVEQKTMNKLLEFASSKVQSERVKRYKLEKQKSGLMHDLLTGKVSVNVDSDAP